MTIWSRVRQLFSSEPQLAATVARAQSVLQYPRPDQVSDIRDAVLRRENVAVFGPARQGKTSRVLEALEGMPVLYVECRPEFKRTHIYRLILSHVGYSISVSEKKTAKYDVKLSIPGLPVSGGGDGGTEVSIQKIAIDLRNPSEVAHVIAQIHSAPTVVLNAFHLLNRKTIENLLLDIAFFSEKSELRFVIVGIWNDADHLEGIEPAIAGKLHHVHIPLWPDEKLRSAYAWLCDKKGRSPVAAKVLDEMVSLAGGDISLFLAISDIPSDTSFDAFHGEAKRLAITRSRRGLQSRLRQFLSQRQFSLYYLRGTVEYTHRPNPAFVPNQNGNPAPYRQSSINPRTGRPYEGGRRMNVDAQGHHEYLEEFNGQLERQSVFFGKFLFQKLYLAAREGRQDVSISDLSKALVAELLPDGLGVELNLMSKQVAGLGEAQRLALIIPPLISVDADRGQLNIADRRLTLTLLSMEPDEVDEWLADCVPDEVPQPRKSASVNVPVTEEQQRMFLNQLVRRYLAQGVANGGRAEAEMVEDDDDVEAAVGSDGEAAAAGDVEDAADSDVEQPEDMEDEAPAGSREPIPQPLRSV